MGRWSLIATQLSVQLAQLLVRTEGSCLVRLLSATRAKLSPSVPVAVPPIRRRASEPVTESEVYEARVQASNDTQGQIPGERRPCCCVCPGVLSASGATGWTSASSSFEPCGPVLDIWPEPELYAPIAEIHDRARHVLMAPLVEADAVAVRQLQDVGDGLGVDQVLSGDIRTHHNKATSVDGYVRRSC
jgi:hypothetical protein